MCWHRTRQLLFAVSRAEQGFWWISEGALVRDVWCKQSTIQWAAIVGRGAVQCGVAKLWPDTLWVWHWQRWCANRHLSRKHIRSRAVKMVGTPLLSKLTSSQRVLRAWMFIKGKPAVLIL